MKFPVNFESPRTARSNFLTILFCCVVAAALVGALVGFVGYVPRIEFVVMTPSVAIGGAMVGLVLGPLLAYGLFRGRVSNRAFYGSTGICALVGVIGALVFRLLTNSEGGWLGGLPAVLGAVLGAVWYKTQTK